MNAVGAGSSDRKHEFEATATSGAGGGGTVAVAGSFALNIVDVSSTALMRADGIRGPPTVNSSNNVLLESESSVSSTTKALSVKQVFDPQTAVADNAIQLPSVLKHADGSPLKTGDAVIYSDGGGAPIGGIEDGNTYFVRVTGAGKIELYDTKAHADNTASTDGRKALDKAKARGSEHAFTVGGSSEGAKVGVGASISLNLVTDVTQAGVEDDTTSLAHNIVGAHNITVHANGENALETEAQSGSAGGVAVTAAIAVAIDNVTTSASFGTGAGIVATGAIDAHATQAAETKTTPRAPSAARTSASASRSRSSSPPTRSTPAASATCTRPARSPSSPTSPRRTRALPPPARRAHRRTTARATRASTTRATRSSATPTRCRWTTPARAPARPRRRRPSTGEKDQAAGSSDDDKASVSVAGAVTIAIIETSATAGFSNGRTILSDTGVITIKSSANTDSAAEAKGDTATESSVGVGAGIVVNLVTITNQASTGASSVHGTGLDVEAGMNGNDADPIKHWTGSAWETVDEGEWFPVTPKNGDYFRLTAKYADKDPGVYKWDSSVNSGSWTLQTVAGGGSDLPTAPTANELWRHSTHTISSDADSGASNGDVGVAGSLALNIVHNHTEAFAPTGSNLAGTTAGVTFKAQATIALDAKAHATVEDAENVGVGASISLNLLIDNIVRAEIVDGVPLAGGTSITVEALSALEAGTSVEAGAEGGTAITPAVALFTDLNDHTTARIGTSTTALNGSGALKIHAVHTVDAKTEGKGEAKSSGVAVGAVLTIAIAPGTEWTTKAELARDATAASVEVAAESEYTAETTSLAAANGADKNKSGEKSADEKKNATVDGNKNLEGKTDSSSLPSANDTATEKKGNANGQTGGESGGSVGVAASISVNWIVTSNTATISGGRTVHATSGEVKVSAVNTTITIAKATGISVSTSSDSSDARVGVAVGLNVAEITNSATVDNNSSLEGDDITVEAVTPAGAHDDFVVWGMAAAGGKSDASIGASIGIQVVSYHATAKIGTGSTITSHGDLTIQASSPIRVQDLALSAALSVGGTAIGASIAVNVLDDVVTEAYIDSSAAHVTTVTSDGAVRIAATALLGTITIDIPKPGGGNLFTTPGISSVAIAGGASSGDDPAISGSLVIDVYSLKTHAWIGDNASVTGASIEVTATDDTSIMNLAGALSLSTGGAGVGVGRRRDRQQGRHARRSARRPVCTRRPATSPSRRSRPRSCSSWPSAAPAPARPRPSPAPHRRRRLERRQRLQDPRGDQSGATVHGERPDPRQGERHARQLELYAGNDRRRRRARPASARGHRPRPHRGVDAQLPAGQPDGRLGRHHVEAHQHQDLTLSRVRAAAAQRRHRGLGRRRRPDRHDDRDARRRRPSTGRPVAVSRERHDAT